MTTPHAHTRARTAMPVVEIGLHDIPFAVDVINAIPRTIRDIYVNRDEEGSAGTIRLTVDEHRRHDDGDEAVHAAAVALAALASSPSVPAVRLCSPYVTTRIWRGNGDDDFMCPVCQEEIETREELAVLSCGHHYHTRCAHSLTACAVCRSSSEFVAPNPPHDGANRDAYVR